LYLERIEKVEKITIPLMIILIMLVSSCSSKEEAALTYENPVFEPVIADPSIIKATDGHFYAFGTEDDWGDGKGTRLFWIKRYVL
jgi:arabinan endo-1,5-alpha-L-arabinosidase